jgi:hypothetical protein
MKVNLLEFLIVKKVLELKFFFLNSNFKAKNKNDQKFYENSNFVLILYLKIKLFI